jgi:hypothetical protein
MWKRIAALTGFVLAALSGAAAGEECLSRDDLGHIKTVGVISAVGQTFLFQHIRDARFEWFGPPDSHFLEISDWALDSLVTREVTTALAKRFAIKPVFYDPADFSAWDDGLLRHHTLDLNVDPAIDAYVLILRDWRRDEIGHSVHDLGGLGVYRRDEAKGVKLGLFASYRIAVVDALTGKTIASRAALFPDGALPWMPIAPALWPATQNDLTDKQSALLTADETKLIEATLLPTLSAMNLTR